MVPTKHELYKTGFSQKKHSLGRILGASILLGKWESYYYFASYSLEYGKQNLPLKSVRFFTRCLPIKLALKRMLARLSENFLPRLPKWPKEAKIAKVAKVAKIAQIAEIAKIAETEIVFFLKNFQNLGLFSKKRWVFLEKN